MRTHSDLICPRAWTILAPDDHLMNVVEAEPADWGNKGLDRHKMHGHASLLQMHNTRGGLLILDRNANPNPSPAAGSQITLWYSGRRPLRLFSRTTSSERRPYAQGAPFTSAA
jgi:hypothetical protein